MKSRHDIGWHRIVRYLTGEYASEEEEELQAWIVEDAKRARRVDELKQIWDATTRPVPPRDVDAAWREVKEKLQRKKGPQEAPASPQQRSQSPNGRNTRASKRSSRSRWQPLFRGAAVLGIVAVTALLTVFLLKEPGLGLSSAEEKVFTTEEGQRAVVQLSDGSKVHLNVDSRLVLSEEFDTGRREVHLKGEAYFEVTEAADRSFVVRIEGATVEVLGTAFDVRSYADDEERRVAVSKGNVALRSQQAETKDTVLLGARQLGVIAGRHVQVIRRGVDLSQELAWKEGKLVFADAPFDEVTRKLERWYDLHIEMQVTPEEVDRLNATFDDESVGAALKAVAAGLDLRYRRNGRTVVFYREGRAPARSARK